MKWMRKVTIPDNAIVPDHKDMNKLKADRLILRSREPIPNHYYIKGMQLGTLHPFNYLILVESRSHEMCIVAVQQNGYALGYVHEQTDEICMVAVKQVVLALKYVKNKTYEICMAAVQQNGHALQFIESSQ